MVHSFFVLWCSSQHKIAIATSDDSQFYRNSILDYWTIFWVLHKTSNTAPHVSSPVQLCLYSSMQILRYHWFAPNKYAAADCGPDWECIEYILVWLGQHLCRNLFRYSPHIFADELPEIEISHNLGHKLLSLRIYLIVYEVLTVLIVISYSLQSQASSTVIDDQYCWMIQQTIIASKCKIDHFFNGDLLPISAYNGRSNISSFPLQSLFTSISTDRHGKK